ncbi:hypothetical protein M3Y97_00936100 [Aphelenchoides bicaudatus]|nr:hypothetical protein M3Y97_00936100 [Aphelenchoides bicaudatus]
MSMSTRIFGPPTALNRSLSTRQRASVAEETDDYFDDSDADARSQHSLFTAINLSPTIPSSPLDVDSPKPSTRAQQFRRESIGETPTSPLVGAEAVSVTVTKSRVITQKSVPPPLNPAAGGFENIPTQQNAAFEAIQQMRNVMNNRFDQLIAQLTKTDTDQPICLPIEAETSGTVTEPYRRVQTPSSAPPRSMTASPKRIAFTLTGPEDKFN